ncbi:hypothetical protein [Lacipirellula limnantheis]|uniref:Uncharacterized protein n=1 Tax=Lacipirellula limnantheis TaxID=2528024 RepID=A0A517U2K3_9BACT|nr:hypothetical protein [Lacipirellula limnantheis]QDT74858.1 hypothetical protein I41_40620 [Lacipirellula limnantheis]
MEQHDDDDSMPGQDSFIDVVCNMVGILIVLVMIVGVRASRPAEFDAAMMPKKPKAASGVKEQLVDSRELEKLIEEANKETRELEREAERMVDLAVQAALTEQRRQALLTLQASVEQQIAERRAKLDEAGKTQFDVQRAIAEAEMKLSELTQEQVSLVSQTIDVEEVECVPTPLAKTVEGDEIHVRIKRGMLAVVPSDGLLDEFRARGGDYIRSGLRDRNSVEDVYGPIDGFRMRLSVKRHTVSVQGPPGVPMPQQTVPEVQAVFLPVSEDIGQTIDQALLPSSPFMRQLKARRTARPAVTAWVYPDSYGELRTLKRAMWEAGVALAIRPLPNGQPIIFSTNGSKSSAQ